MDRPSPRQQLARSLRRSQTDAERRLWSRLRDRRLIDAKFRRQHPVGPFIADFCCVEHQLIVELDGGQHATRRDADARRTSHLASLGYRVIRFWDNDVFTNLDGVLHAIARELSPSPRPSPPRGEGEES